MASIKKRVTRQRRVILEELRKVRTHPTADEVYAMVRRRLPRVSLGTVYRNLDLLAADGEILKLQSAGSSKRFDGTAAPHQHVRCSKCGRIADLETALPLPDINALFLPGFRITEARLEFDGVCDDCCAVPVPMQTDEVHDVRA